MTILDTWDNMTDEEQRAALIESLDKVDRETWECIAACVDVYQRKEAGTIHRLRKEARPALAMDKDSFIVKQQVIPGEDTLKRIDRVIESNRRDVYGGSPKQKIFFLGLDCYLLGRCDGQRAERERRHSRKMECCVFNGRSTR